MFIKLCGLRRLDEVHVARELTVHAIGINLVQSARRAVDLDTAFALTEAARDLRVFFVVDASPPTELPHLLKATPHGYVQRTDASWAWPAFVDDAHRVDVVRLRHPEDIEAAAGSLSRLVISDAAAGLGGTGQLGDWALSAALAVRRDTVLAGGLTPDNVALAIRTVRPFGVDVASGIEENGHITEARMRAFVAAVRGVS